MILQIILLVPVLLFLTFIWCKRKTYEIRVNEFINTVIGVLALYATVAGVIPQLFELNKKAIIEFRMLLNSDKYGFSTSTSMNISFGTPFEIKLIATNKGDVSTSLWKSAILPCNGVGIIDKSPNLGWKKLQYPEPYNGVSFYLESERLLVNNPRIFLPEKDIVGIFDLDIPAKEGLKEIPHITPLLYVVTEGDQVKLQQKIFYIEGTEKTGFVQKEKILKYTEELELLGCYNKQQKR